MKEKEIKALIVEAIDKQYGMNVYQFSNSDYPGKIGVSGGNTFRCYLTGPASSVPFYTKMCAFLKLGKVEKHKKIIKEVDFVLTPFKRVPTTVSGSPVKRVLGTGKTPRKLGKKK